MMKEKYRRMKMASLLKPTVSTKWYAIIFILNMWVCNFAIWSISLFAEIEILGTLCFFLAAYLGLYIQMCCVRNEKSQTKIIPISSKEWLWSYLDMYGKVMALATLVIVAIYAFMYIQNWIRNTFYTDMITETVQLSLNLGHEIIYKWLIPIILGIRILGINMITFGIKHKLGRIIAVILGYLVFTVTATLEFCTWYEIKPIAIPICLTLLVSLIWAVIGFVVTYYRIKPKKYEAG